MKQSKKPIIERCSEYVLDLVFPTRCAGCGQPGSLWCPSCESRLERILPPICTHCGSPLRTQSHCHLCRARKPSLPVRSYARYSGPVTRAILQLKYRPDRRLAKLMAEWLYSIDWPGMQQVSLVVPVPLGQQKLRERGYNQANLIALPFAKIINRAHSDRILVRQRETPSQVGLDVEDRWENVRAAFSVREGLSSGHHVLIIDDLCTTGATLSACAEAVCAAGAASAIGLTVGRA